MTFSYFIVHYFWKITLRENRVFAVHFNFEILVEQGEGGDRAGREQKESKMKSSEVNNGESEMKREHKKPLFRPAKDDTKPLLQDPVRSSLSLSLSLLCVCVILSMDL